MDATESFVSREAENKQYDMKESYHLSSEAFNFPAGFLAIRDKIRTMEIRPDDIWVCAFPKSGTTWVQEAVWCIANDVDLETAKKLSQAKRSPYLEKSANGGIRKLERLYNVGGSEASEDYVDSVTAIEKSPSPRFIKSHLPLALLPEKLRFNSETKIVYVTRNPRDVCISYHHFLQLLGKYDGSFEKFSDEWFFSRKFSDSPYWEHNLQFWRMRKGLNILFISYEEMKKDLKKAVLKIAAFLGKTLTDEQLGKLIEHLSFESMKNNKILNVESDPNSTLIVGGTYVRCGRSGQWKDVLSQPLVQQFEEWEREHLKDNDFPLDLDASDL